jgi:hypothetical protein
LLDAELRRLVVVVGDVDVVVVIHIHARGVRVIDERSFGLDVMSDILAVLVDDVVRMLEVVRRWLSYMAGIVELLLLLLELESLLLLLLTVLRGVAVFFTFFFTLSFLGIVRCALSSIWEMERRVERRDKNLEIDEICFRN